eukprot:TRINITY_DN6917_c0_g1_i1.p1 TRINITY_DN6917_c0_g1~~TRINITY_DN6917_c0_g1_i1.p1  ORF type:complete len:811 (-),score=137.84 TRINITY_DN6917_c0_g1_i1:314-2746(-)
MHNYFSFADKSSDDRPLPAHLSSRSLQTPGSQTTIAATGVDGSTSSTPGIAAAEVAAERLWWAETSERQVDELIQQFREHEDKCFGAIADAKTNYAAELQKGMAVVIEEFDMRLSSLQETLRREHQASHDAAMEAIKVMSVPAGPDEQVRERLEEVTAMVGDLTGRLAASERQLALEIDASSDLTGRLSTTERVLAEGKIEKLEQALDEYQKQFSEYQVKSDGVIHEIKSGSAFELQKAMAVVIEEFDLRLSSFEERLRREQQASHEAAMEASRMMFQTPMPDKQMSDRLDEVTAQVGDLAGRLLASERFSTPVGPDDQITKRLEEFASTVNALETRVAVSEKRLSQEIDVTADLTGRLSTAEKRLSPEANSPKPSAAGELLPILQSLTRNGNDTRMKEIAQRVESAITSFEERLASSLAEQRCSHGKSVSDLWEYIDRSTGLLEADAKLNKSEVQQVVGALASLELRVKAVESSDTAGLEHSIAGDSDETAPQPQDSQVARLLMAAAGQDSSSGRRQDASARGGVMDRFRSGKATNDRVQRDILSHPEARALLQLAIGGGPTAAVQGPCVSTTAMTPRHLSPVSPRRQSPSARSTGQIQAPLQGGSMRVSVGSMAGQAQGVSCQLAVGKSVAQVSGSLRLPVSSAASRDGNVTPRMPGNATPRMPGNASPRMPSRGAVDRWHCPHCSNVYTADTNFCRVCGQRREGDALGLTTSAPSASSADMRSLRSMASIPKPDHQASVTSWQCPYCQCVYTADVASCRRCGQGFNEVERMLSIGSKCESVERQISGTRMLSTQNSHASFVSSRLLP